MRKYIIFLLFANFLLITTQVNAQAVDSVSISKSQKNIKSNLKDVNKIQSKIDKKQKHIEKQEKRINKQERKKERKMNRIEKAQKKINEN